MSPRMRERSTSWVNNAGVLGKLGPVEEYTAADVSAVLDVNVVGIARVTHCGCR